MKGIIITGYHEKNSNVIHLFVRCADGTKREIVIDDFYPYFYVRDSIGDAKSIFGEPLRRIQCTYPEEVSELRDRVYGKKNSYEADIPFVQRFLIDNKIYSGIETETLLPCDVRIDPRLMYIDLEVVQDEDKLICWTIWDSYTDIYITNILADESKVIDKGDHLVFYSESEVELIKNLLTVLNEYEPDVLGGWNLRFDEKMIQHFAKKYGYACNLNRFDKFELFEAYKALFKPMSTRLKDVAEDEGLVKDPIEWEEAYEAYKNGDYETMVKYNSDDVRYCVEIDKKHQIFKFWWELKQFIGVDKLSTLDRKGDKYSLISTGKIVDMLMLRLAKDLGIVLPSMGTAEKQPYEGAYVYYNVKGKERNVAVFDAARMYPTIILSLNISPETLYFDENGNVRFRQDKPGLFALVCKWLLEKREEIEKEMKRYDPYSEEWNNLKVKRDIVKFAANAVYGYAGWKESRLYNKYVAETITGVGRAIVKHLIDFCDNELKHKVLISDTDSVIISFKDKEFNQELLDYLHELSKVLSDEATKVLKQLGGKVPMKIKFERFASVLFATGVKKRYAMRVIWEDDKPCNYVVIKGYEAIRTDVSKYVKNFLRGLFDIILREDTTEDDIRKYILKGIEEFKKQPLEDIALRKGLNKELHEYSANQDFVRAAYLANRYLGCRFKKGDKVKYVYVRSVRGLPVSTDVIGFEYEGQIKDKVVIDWDKMIEKQIYEKIDDILKVLGIPSIKKKVMKFSDLFKKRKQ